MSPGASLGRGAMLPLCPLARSGASSFLRSAEKGPPTEGACRAPRLGWEELHTPCPASH